MKKLIVLFVAIITIAAYTEIKEQTKKAINKSGEVVSKTATEFVEGISEGVDKTLQCELSLAQALTDKGLKTSAHSIQSSREASDNKLQLYLIFSQNFNTPLTLKA